MEANVFPLHRPERADLIDGTIGELSPFHETYGYYAQGVGRGTAILPRGWEQRLIVVKNANTRGAAGLCLEIHDLVIAKLLAGREKDLDFLRQTAGHGSVTLFVLLERLAAVDGISQAQRAVADRRIRAAFHP